MNFKFPTICLSTLVLAGCATQASLTLVSEPVGAYFTEIPSGRSHGIGPTKVFYDAESLKQHLRSDGCFVVNGFEARWVSGARKIVPLICLKGQADGAYTQMFQRDMSAPNLAQDLQFALQRESLLAQQQQAKAAKDSADAALFQAFAPLYMPRPVNAPQPGYMPQPEYAPQPITCISSKYALGNSIQTTCK